MLQIDRKLRYVNELNFSMFSDVIDIKYEKKETGVPASYIYSRPHFKINESDFFLDMKNVARYRVQNGQQVLICPYEEPVRNR